MNDIFQRAAQDTATKTDVCATHGEFTSRQFLGRVWTKCPKCAEEAEIQRKAEAEAAEQDKKVRAWEARIGQAQIPQRFHDRSLDNFVADTDAKRKALNFAREYAGSFTEVLETGRCGIFVGKPGTGKTHLAVAVGLHAMRAGHAVLFSTVMRAIRRVKDSWSRDSRETETQAVAGLVFPDLLILDEVGVQFGSETERLILFDVLNERYEKRKPTLLLSNLNIDEVKGFLGERIFDRLREDGGRAVVFDWESHRGRS